MIFIQVFNFHEYFICWLFIAFMKKSKNIRKNHKNIKSKNIARELHCACLLLKNGLSLTSRRTPGNKLNINIYNKTNKWYLKFLFTRYETHSWPSSPSSASAASSWCVPCFAAAARWRPPGCRPAPPQCCPPWTASSASLRSPPVQTTSSALLRFGQQDVLYFL